MLRLIPAFIFLLTFICSGCSFLFSSAYGYKNPKKLNQTEIATMAAAYQIPAENSFELDSAYYYGLLKSFDQKQYGEQVKNHYQPLQALYFDKHGNLQAFYINCYSPGFPNLKWNSEETLNAFPPKTQAPLDSLIDLQTLNRYLKPVSGKNQPGEIAADYTVVIFWNRVLGRQSKRLIETIKHNCTLADNQKVDLIYVNNDNLLAKIWQ